ncbi:hypothetical protein BG60_26215 [Caballeronia zhejiangensis]|uniref:Uncharacterized protein n=2 Tax=Caballeronia zhejiangensis TaxID=871203 RepID=A0A656QCH4_9BURK|nr:hypothetical protein BG60_26215 [Caballeronia zhejiangensis]
MKSLEAIAEYAPLYAKAKSERIYLEQFRKTKKALLMQAAQEAGVKVSATQERDAYAHPEYQELLVALRAAVEEEERLRWFLVGAEAKIEVWRTMEANRRAEAKNL